MLSFSLVSRRSLQPVFLRSFKYKKGDVRLAYLVLYFLSTLSHWLKMRWTHLSALLLTLVYLTSPSIAFPLTPRAGSTAPTQDACNTPFQKLKSGDSALQSPPKINLRTANPNSCFASATTASADSSVQLQQGQALFFGYTDDGTTTVTGQAVRSFQSCLLHSELTKLS